MLQSCPYKSGLELPAMYVNYWGICSDTPWLPLAETQHTRLPNDMHRGSGGGMRVTPASHRNTVEKGARETRCPVPRHGALGAECSTYSRHAN